MINSDHGGFSNRSLAQKMFNVVLIDFYDCCHPLYNVFERLYIKPGMFVRGIVKVEYCESFLTIFILLFFFTSFQLTII